MSVTEKAINTIRFLAVDAIEKAKSGHPGLPMGGAAMAYVLWHDCLKHNPRNPDWPDRDRFVLSAGHGSMLLYALLHITGYELSLDDIKGFRQWGSKTPGHPEYGQTPGVETTTGPLGQGFANAVGMAIAERRMAAEFNRPGFPIVDHYTYVYAGDGCLMEGLTQEAASLAGHLGLGKLICLYDDNRITIDGPTHITFTEDVARRFSACGWQVLQVKDGNDPTAVKEAIQLGQADEDRPTLICVRTEIGYGSPNYQGSEKAHGAPLGKAEVCLAKKNLGWPADKELFVPREVYDHFAGKREKWQAQEDEWNQSFARYQEQYPNEAACWEEWHNPKASPEFVQEVEALDFAKPLATRAASGQVMQIAAKYYTNLCGGSADLNNSTKTYLKGWGDFQTGKYKGNNIYFGVREHAMGAICNGIVLHGGLRAFASTFLVFADYMKPSIRMAALMRLPLVYVFTHDSIAVGEDGPTHQPVDQLPMLRSIPGLCVMRPADGRETAWAWIHALNQAHNPVALVLTRQGVQPLAGTGRGILKGAYILAENGSPDIALLASGSEVQLAVEVNRKLREAGVSSRVVSVASIDLFLSQSREYRKKVLPDTLTKRVAIEAAYPMGWDALLGKEGRLFGIDRFGASAPGGVIMEKYGFTVDNIYKEVQAYLQE